MLPRDRFLDAVDLLQPDRVPITDLGLDPPIVERIIGRNLDAMSLLALDKDDPRESSLRTRKAMTEACLRLGFDAVSAISDYSICSRDYRPKPIGDSRFIDEWGRIVEPRQETKTAWWVGGTVETEEDLENYVPPDPEKGEAYEMIAEAVGTLEGSDVAIMAQGHAGWHMSFQVRGGIDKLLIDMYRRPRLIGGFLKQIADTCYTLVKYMIDAGIDALFITDDYADNKLPFMSMDLFRRYELPYIRRVARLAKGRGVPLLKHSDGNLGPYVEDLIRTGIRGIHPLEQGPMDLEAGKARYGDRICILGNVDCRFVLPMGSESLVRADVRRCLKSAASGGGYVLTSSNSIHANCLVDNVRIMVDEAKKRGLYDQG